MMAQALKPGTVDELVQAIEWAVAGTHPLELVGGGSKRALGRPLQAEMTLDLSDLSGIREYQPEELVLTAGAATPLAEVEAADIDEALDRIKAYSQTGVEAIRLAGLRTRDQLEAVHRATPLPITVLSPPADMKNDLAYMAANGIRIMMAGNPSFGMAIQAIYDCFKHLKEGGSVEDLAPREADAALLRQVNRTDEFIQLQERFLRG